LRDNLNDTDDGWPKLVVFAKPFVVSHEPLPEMIRFNEVNNQILWKAQFLHLPTGQIVACDFAV
jgi:hypothetical protein